MRSGIAVVAFVSFVVITASCLVDRKTGDYACARDEDCAGFTDPERICDTSIGYCVPQECPSACNGGCDLRAKTCAISCGGANSCSSVSCPSGYACTLNCGGNNSCDNVDCSDAASCTINCASQNSCANVRCGDGPCRVMCVGSNACDNVDCNNSCACDVTCSGTNCATTTCSALTCETALGCSSALPGCNTCP